MKFKNKLFLNLLIPILGLLTSCQEPMEFGNSKLAEDIDFISLEQFEQNPENYHNDTIKIRGTLYVEYENVSIKLNNISIWIETFEPSIIGGLEEDKRKKLNGDNVELTGIYNAEQKGHLGLFNGHFTKVFYMKSKFR